ncbi:DNA sulfur modification protein DndD [Salinibius halmophilus]|uniref:DNA sulfur modification protein DndD n=1 Tax=Salinibius halmophilus TaxID=1853216 RepID=UPI000E66C469|nr:DNA sulfur modification protein DndD [Salinibius halmophilus]
MIIQSLTLHNYRVFAGTHNIDLTPDGVGRNLVLFGGLNGAGKTSILSAIKLALYGQRALGSNLTQKQYIEKLSQLIHLGNETLHPNDARIELAFQYSQEGQTSTIKVIRSWQRDSKDDLHIFVNKTLRQELSYDQCQSYLDGIIPAGVAELFFFDGEKIAELAEDESGTILRTAVKRLLGLNTVEKLQSDLAIHLKKEGVTKADAKTREQLAEYAKQRKQLDSEAEVKENELTKVNNQVEFAKKEISLIEQQMSEQGGAWAQSREDELKKVEDIVKEKAALEKQLRNHIDGFYPISLAKNATKALLEQLSKEAEIKENRAFVNKLDQLAGNQVGLDQSTIAHLKSSVQFDDSEVLLDLSDREYHQLQYQINDLAVKAERDVKKIRKQIKQLDNQLEQARDNVQRAPQQEQLEKLLNKLRTAEDNKTKAAITRVKLLEELKQDYMQAQDIARKEQRLHNELAAQLEYSESIENAQNAQLVLADFAHELSALRVKQLEQEFITSYQQLARKEDLDISARINPESFDVELIDENGKVINRKQLSAGEKQIYAIAILEALGKVSGHKLPVIIDTPLGRLDSAHRDKLIKHYLPNASHQVVVLSTDTEVDEQYYQWLEPHLSHSYEIQFNATAKASTLNEGYFWQQAQEAQ